MGMIRPVSGAVRKAVGSWRTLAPSDPILALFANGERGAWLPAWNLPKLFQSSDGTGSVLFSGDPIGKVTDQDGQTDNSITQATSAKKPTLQHDGDGRPYIDFDGVDDFLQSAPGLFPDAISELWMACAVDTNDGSVRNTVCGISDGGYSAADVWAIIDYEISGETRFALNRSFGFSISEVPSVVGSPAILHGIYDDTNGSRLRINGSQASNHPNTIGAITVNQNLDVGAIDNGGDVVAQSPIRLYGLLIRDRAPSVEEISLVDEILAAHSPVTLP